jgi:formamidopyrimidine-DNA glycosylase
MPELPELEVVSEVLCRRVLGQTIADVQVAPAGSLVVRDLTHAGFAPTLTGSQIVQVERRGKFLLFTLAGSHARADARVGAPAPAPLYLVVNPKLTGRLQWCEPDEKRMPRTHVVFTLSGGRQLRYVDQKRMGQLYLTRAPSEVPDFAAMGPEALDIALDDFRSRIRKFRGEIKGVLTRGDFVAGIGNAYADEILWNARLYPFRKRTSLGPEEIERLYEAMRETLLEATAKVRAEMGEDIHRKPREFMAVHMQTGEPCPRCGTTVSLIGANQRITNFCRTCQPGSMFRGGL